VRLDRCEQRGLFTKYEPEDCDDEYETEDPSDPEEDFPLGY
jgi:hypothetical protein